MKLLVKTKGLLLTTMMGEVMYPHRASVVINSAFLQGKIARQDVTVLEQLADHATDAEWEKFLLESKGDYELALTAYKSFLAGETEDTQAEAEAAAKAAAEAEAAAKAAAEAEAEAKAAAEAEAAAKAAAEAEAEAEAAAKAAAEADKAKKGK